MASKGSDHVAGSLLTPRTVSAVVLAEAAAEGWGAVLAGAGAAPEAVAPL